MRQHVTRVKWNYWFNDSAQVYEPYEYEKNLFKLTEQPIDSIEKFWSVYNNTPKVLEIPEKTCFHLMREHIKPLWEDKDNFEGGILKFYILKGDLQEIWKEILILLISSEHSRQYDEDLINGISYISKGELPGIIQVWTAKPSKPEDFISIVKNILPTFTEVEFGDIVFRCTRDLLRGLKKKSKGSMPNNNRKK